MARTGDAFLAYLRAERGLSTNTVDAYKAEAKYRRATIRRRVSALRTFWKFLMREEQVTANPFALVELPKERKTLPRYLEEAGTKRLLKVPGQRPADFRDRALLHLAYSCGLRVSELTGLRVQDVLPNAVRVMGKRTKERIVPIDPRTLRYVRDYIVRGRPALMKEHRTDRVFLRVRTGGMSGEGHPLDRRSIPLILSKHCQEAGISYVNPHALRHSIATHMLDSGHL
jgi:site-specific recombinase XerD